MTAFMDENFLLENKVAKQLYHDVAATLPIVDFHCHIEAKQIYENKRFQSLSEAWLSGDHYKWRLMRANGTPEKVITGDAAEIEKFRAFAEVLPRAIGNPVYHWAHLELQRFFGCRLPLNPATATQIWNICNEQLANDENLRVRGIIEQMKVEAIVTTDDPVDDLESHINLACDDSFKTKVLPGWRPDAVLNIEKTNFEEYIKTLGGVSDTQITDYSTLKAALKKRMDFFNKNGCKACDHGILSLSYAPACDDTVNKTIEKRLSGAGITKNEADAYRYSLMVFLGKEYAKLGWVMEIHVGVKRNANTKMFATLGADTGFDCVDPMSATNGIAEFLDELQKSDALPKTMIFSINPNDNQTINTLAACFQEEGIRGKVQQGSAWWFNDTYNGMKQQIESFAEGGVLSNFVGMLTDSRSFLSYTRHEYFRRILCNTIGHWVKTGKYPNDTDSLKEIIEDICYNNAKSYFGF